MEHTGQFSFFAKQKVNTIHCYDGKPVVITHNKLSLQCTAIFYLVCHLIESGISGLVSDVSCETSQLLNSQLSTFGIPHITVSPQGCR